MADLGTCPCGRQAWPSGGFMLNDTFQHRCLDHANQIDPPAPAAAPTAEDMEWDLHWGLHHFQCPHPEAYRAACLRAIHAEARLAALEGERASLLELLSAIEPIQKRYESPVFSFNSRQSYDEVINLLQVAYVVRACLEKPS